MHARREERWHYGSHVVIARGGQRKTWHAVARTGTGIDVGAAGGPRALTRFCFLLHEVRLMRKPRNPCHVKRRSCEHTEP